VDGIDDEALETAGDQVRRAFESRARLAALARSDDLLDARPALAMQVELEHELAPRRGANVDAAARVQLVGGTSSTVETSAAALALVQSLDGKTVLRRLLARSSPAVRRDALRLCRELLELGALRF
jgi:hypothetical protein